MILLVSKKHYNENCVCGSTLQDALNHGHKKYIVPVFHAVLHRVYFQQTKSEFYQFTAKHNKGLPQNKRQLLGGK